MNDSSGREVMKAESLIWQITLQYSSDAGGTNTVDARNAAKSAADSKRKKAARAEVKSDYI